MFNKRSKVIHSSLKELEAAAFDVVNYVTPNASLVAANLTLTADTKKGVLGGSVAAYVGGYLVGQGSHEKIPAGLFVQDAIPDNFTNAPAIAGNKLPVAGFGGEAEIDVFETHSWVNFNSILAGYVAGQYLYSSPNGLLTREAPSDVDIATGLDLPVGRLTWVPTSTNLIMGVDVIAPS